MYKGDNRPIVHILLSAFESTASPFLSIPFFPVFQLPSYDFLLRKGGSVEVGGGVVMRVGAESYGFADA